MQGDPFNVSRKTTRIPVVPGRKPIPYGKTASEGRSAESAPSGVKQQLGDSHSSKPKLSDFMRDTFLRLYSGSVQGGGHIKRAAAEMGLGYDALRKDLEKNKFTDAAIRAFCALARIDPHEVTPEKFAFEPKAARGASKLKRASQLIDADNDITLAAMHKHLEKWIDSDFGVDCVAAKIIPNLFRALGNWDRQSHVTNPNAVFIFVSDELPSYLAATTIGSKAVENVRMALASGASICHLCPNPVRLPSPWNFPIRPPMRASELQEIIDGQYAKKDAVSNNIWAISHDSPQFTLPHHRYVLYSCDVGVFSTLTVPIMGHSAIDSSLWPIVPLAKDMTNLLRNIVIKSLLTHIEQGNNQESTKMEQLVMQLQKSDILSP